MQISADHAELVKAIPPAFEANRAALQSGTIRFRYAVGMAASPAAALKNAWSKRHESEGVYAYSGRRGMYSLVATPEVMASAREKTGQGHWTSQVYSVRVLTNGVLTLWDQVNLGDDGKEINHYAEIAKGSERFYQDSSVPLGLGHPSPSHYQLGRDIERARRDQPDWKLSRVEQATIDGVGEVVVLTFDFPDGRCEYRVDLEHGALPRRYRVENYKIKSVMNIYWEDLRFVANKAWYPHREVVFFEGDGAAKEWAVEEADFATPPSDSLFRLTFPRPIGVLNAASSPMVKYPPRATWDLETLPSPNAPGTKPIVLMRPSSDPAPKMPGERETEFGSYVPWIAGVAAFLTIAGIYLGRRLRR